MDPKKHVWIVAPPESAEVPEERDTYPDVASKIQTIRRIGASLRAEDTSAIYFLQRVFDYDTEEVREAAAEALTVLSHPEFKQALGDVAAFVEERESGSVEAAAPPCTSLFLQALGNPERHVRCCAARALVNIGGPVVSDLLEALTNADDNVRCFAASALGRIGDPVAIPALAHLLRDRKRSVQDCAEGALIRYGSSAVSPVVEELRDERSRLAAVRTLGWIGDATAVPALLQTMQSADPNRTWEYWKA
ncbi:MAG: lyase domain protein repeat-containing protein, partial [Chthonomonadales bacterium]|nr:lyase domain protein repeat-containing protein [Chthonomonadales bacterium]